MENAIALFGLLAIRCWNGFLKPFLLAMSLGILAGACFGDLAFAAPAGRPALERSTAAELITRAGRIRQQAQRIGKLFQQSGLRIDAEQASRQLGKARQQMDADIARLTQAAMADKDRQILERIRDAWKEMALLCDQPFSANNQETLTARADDISMLGGRLAMHFELDATAASARLLDLTLRQGMIVQRLARLYLTAYAGNASTGLLLDIEQARREFSTALNELASAPENSPASTRAIDLARMQWLFFDQSVLNIKDRQASNPKNVATTSERIQEMLDELSAQYARAVESEPPTVKTGASSAS